MPIISIIIPCYNLGSYLDGCLNSISHQEVGEVEYIFVNDGSTDRTLDKIQKFCRGKESYCRIINQSNSGVSNARNAALKLCKGEYLYMLDGDDLLTESAIKEMLRAIKISHADMIISNALILNASGEETLLKLPIQSGKYTPEEFFKKIKVFPTIPKNLYRTEIVKKHTLCFDNKLKFGEVYEFTLRFLCFSKNIFVSDSCYFKYIMRAQSASHAPDYSKDISILDTLKKYNEIKGDFSNQPSYKITMFKMLMAFSYNKYAKLKLINKSATDNIYQIHHDPNVSKLCKDVFALKSTPVKERLLALYFYLTGVQGYKLLVRILNLK